MFNDLLDKLSSAIRHNMGLVVAIVLAVIVLGNVSCDSKIASPIDPTVKLTRDELLLEYDVAMGNIESQLETLERKFVLAERDLDRQDAIKQKVAEIGVVLAEGGTVNPAGIAVSLLGLLGIGAVVDNRIKDVRMKTLENSADSPNTS